MAFCVCPLCGSDSTYSFCGWKLRLLSTLGDGSSGDYSLLSGCLWESFLLGGENGVKEEEQKAEETIKPSMTRLSFIKLLETGPKIAPFCLYSGVSVCACGTVVAGWVETGAASRIHPQAPEHFRSSSPAQADTGVGGQQCVCVTQTPG